VQKRRQGPPNLKDVVTKLLPGGALTDKGKTISLLQLSTTVHSQKLTTPGFHGHTSTQFTGGLSDSEGLTEYTFFKHKGLILILLTAL